MKTAPNKLLVFSLILTVAGIAGLVLAHAQEATGTSSTQTTNSVRNPIINPELAAQLAAVEQLPTTAADAVPRDACNFYSAQFPYWPPLPGNIYDVPIWDLGDGFFLLDDLQINYAETEVTAASSTMAMSARVKLTKDVFSPSYSILNGMYLTITPAGTNQVLITVINNGSPVNYELWWTPVLESPVYPWTPIAVGTTGQTNFTVSTSLSSAGFYRAIWDTNGIPLWEAADPNNPGAGILAVFIDSPTNGAVIQ